MVDFLHGVETISTTVGPKVIREVKTAVVGLTGTAPIHHVAVDKRPALNAIELVTSEEDAARFGPDLPGYTIPAALKAHFAGGEPAGVVMVINVFDPATDKTDVVEAAMSIVAGKIALPHQDVTAVTVKTTDTVPVLCVAGTDYTVDLVAGIITVLEDGLLDGDAQARVAYTRANPSAVTGDDVIGATSAEGVRTGMQCFRGAMAQFGFNPKILIAPVFSATRTVADALRALAAKTKCRAVALADVPVGTPLEDAIAGRGAAADAEVDLGIAEERLYYCYPHVRPTKTTLAPFSPYFAAVIGRTDRTLGYWHSPSNKQIEGIVGTEFALSAAINDKDCDVNRLNAAGIGTIFAAYGTGLRSWGNRSSAFPGTNGIATFLSCLRTRDVLEESIELFTLEHLDGPIGSVLIEAVLADVNEFIRELVGRGALIPGSAVSFDPAKNPASQLADGKIRWTIRFCPPPPAEHITYDSVLDTNLLSNLTGG